MIFVSLQVFIWVSLIKSQVVIKEIRLSAQKLYTSIYHVSNNDTFDYDRFLSRLYK